MRTIALLLLLAIIAATIDFRHLLSILSQLSWPVLWALLALEYLFFLVEAMRLSRLFAGSYSLAYLLRSRLVAGVVGSSLPGGVGTEIVRALLLQKRHPLGLLKVLAILAANRVYGLLGFLLFIGGVLLLFGQNFAAKAVYVGVFIALAAVVLPFCLQLRLVRRSLVFLLRKAPVGRGFLRMLYLTLRRHTGLRSWLMVLGSSALGSGLMVGQMILVGRALGIELDFSTWTVIAFLSGVAAYLPLGIGAIGPQDFSLVMIARWLGQSSEAFVGISLLLHGVRLVSLLPAVLWMNDIFFARLRANNEKFQQSARVDSSPKGVQASTSKP